MFSCFLYVAQLWLIVRNFRLSEILWVAYSANGISDFHLIFCKILLIFVLTEWQNTLMLNANETLQVSRRNSLFVGRGKQMVAINQKQTK